MPKTRLETFSDAVIAIALTIMVLDIRIPQQPTLAALRPALPVLGSYVLSFLYIGIYWGNHHHLVHAARHINSTIMWANLHLLFWLSLVPFATAWFGENHGQPWPTAVYGLALFMSAIAYFLLQRTIIRAHPDHKVLERAFSSDWKGRSSVAGYAAGIALAFVNPWMSLALYIALAVLWFVPDRRAARVIEQVEK